MTKNTDPVEPSGGRVDIDQLRREIAFLADRVAEIARLQSELAAARDHLDQVTRRFGRMQSFMRRGVQTENRKELALLACECAVDILECEIGMLWCFDCPQNQSSLYLSPGYQVDAPGRDEMLQWASRWQALAATGQKQLDLALPSSLGLRETLVEPLLNDAGVTIGLLIAANSSEKGPFHEPFHEATVLAFAAFAEQVGAIMESRRRRELIVAHIKQTRLSEERLSLALEGSNVGLWDWDFETNRVFYSKQWKSQLGYSDEEITDSLNEWSDRLHPDDRETSIATAFEFLRSNRRIYENHFRLLHRDGSWRWIAANGFIIRDPNGIPRRALGTHIDITDYKELEEKLRAAKDQAERASKAKSEFLATVSHEIRTPLNGMVGTFQLLKSGNLDEEQKKLITLGESSGEWMMAIIGDSLDLARIESGKLELNLAPFDPRRLITELMTIKSEKAATKGLKLHWEVAPEVPENLRGDAMRVRQIIANLVGNAIKFTFKGTITVKLSLSRGDSKRPKPLIISVTDNGPGIPVHLAKTIFQPFEQLVPGGNWRTEGIGLGLSITRELVLLMGGSIKVRSRLGKGSRFEVRLPLEEMMSQVMPGPMPITPPTGFHGRVLLVEDDPISREIASIMLSRQGLEVHSEDNGRKGLARLLSEDYDLALVDCWMPELDGLEMTRRLRQEGHGRKRRIPIIALTANTQRSDIDACHDAGMDYYLSKPLLEPSLQACLNRFLHRTVSRRQVSELPPSTLLRPLPRKPQSLRGK